jgi:nitrate/nitrite-specific signal transduction histidine kinase
VTHNTDNNAFYTILFWKDVYYLFALLLIVSVIIAENIVIKTAIKQQQQDAHIINIAGRQRMLSQKITQLCLRLLFYP